MLLQGWRPGGSSIVSLGFQPFAMAVFYCDLTDTNDRQRKERERIIGKWLAWPFLITCHICFLLGTGRRQPQFQGKRSYWSLILLCTYTYILGSRPDEAFESVSKVSFNHLISIVSLMQLCRGGEETGCQGLGQERERLRFLSGAWECSGTKHDNDCTTLRLYQDPLNFIFKDTFPPSFLCLKSILESESYILA